MQASQLRSYAPALLLLFPGCPIHVPEKPMLRLSYVATASQFGPVSFRDPLGAMSPDGGWLAYSVQQHLYLQRLPAGPQLSVPGDAGVIVYLTWTPDSRRIIVDRAGLSPRWRSYELSTGVETPLWPPSLVLQAVSDSGALKASPDSIRQLTWSPQGNRIAGIRHIQNGSELWTFSLTGDGAIVLHSAELLSYPVFRSSGSISCLSDDGTLQVVSFACGEEDSASDIPAYGPIAFSPDGDTIYFGGVDSLASNSLAIRAMPSSANAATQLTNFARDAYAPTVAKDGSVLFKVQNYSTVVGVVAATGGTVRTVSSMQSETPSWDPTGKWLGITYGSWRRVADDFHYPDIAQNVGIIAADPEAPATEPARVIDESPSEDQSLCWSPNGKWLAYHSHKDEGDDIWIVPADLSKPAQRITSFGRGYETGWPRWSPDGRWLAFDADTRGAKPGKSVIYVVGMDQQHGTVTSPEQVVQLGGFGGEAVHAEWLPDSDRLAILGEESAGHWALLVAPRQGGSTRVVHRWQSEHRFAGIGVSPDGNWAAFIAPGSDGHFQLFRIGLSGGGPEQLTFDPTNKTQPSYSPDGRRIALTLWRYDMQFWIMR